MKRHLKRLEAPRLWKIRRKKKYWAVRPRPGPHPLKRSIPLLIVLRDFLGYADTAKEAKKIIKKGEILVDQRVRKDPKFPVGLMDTVTIEDEDFRVLIGKHIFLTPTSSQKAKVKPCKILRKKMVKGKIQLGLHDGRTILLDPARAKYKVGHTLVINLPDQKIKEYIKLKRGNYGIVVGGKIAGNHGKITKVNDLVSIKNKKEHKTVKKYVMAIGKEKPLINLPR